MQILIFLIFFNSKFLKYCSKKINNLFKLPSEEYFIILNDGIYIYNPDFTECSRSYDFNDSQKIPEDYQINILISNFISNNQFYLICLVKEYLYIYNFTNNQIYSKKIDNFPKLKIENDGRVPEYNIIPYKIENNFLYFIISFIKKNDDNDYNQINFFYYNFSFIENKIKYEKKKEPYNHNQISKYYISCNLYFSSDNLECFFTYNKNQKLETFKFSLIDLTSYLQIYEKFSSSSQRYIKKIDSVISNSNQILVCIKGNDATHCFINDPSNNDLKTEFDKCDDLKTYYFNETNEFILFCKNNKKYSIIKIPYSNQDDKKEIIINNNSINSFFLIYNNSTKNYNIITNLNITDDLICNHFENPELDTTFMQDERKTNLSKKTIFIESTNIKMIGIETTIIETTNIKKNIEITNIEKKYIETTNIKTNIETNIETNIVTNIVTNPETNIETKIISIKNSEEIITNYLNISKDDLTNELFNIIDNTEVGKEYIMKGNDFTIKIRPTNSTSYDNSTYVDFNECEKILRNHYNISDSSIVTFFQLELDNNNSQSLINQIEYLTYNDKKVI